MVDLTFSPDWPAWICYGLVLAFGVSTGWQEIVDKADDLAALWRQPSAWFLTFILGVGPALLFWLLDRVGALHDTSAIAAAVVGIAYSQILKGDSEYKAPGSTSPIWNFLSWWRERITKSMQDHAVVSALAFDRTVCELFAEPELRARAIQVAQKLSSDPVKLQADLASEQTRLDAARPALDPKVIDYKIAELVYRELQADPTEMVRSKLIDRALYDRYFNPRPWGIALVVTIILAGGLAGTAAIGPRQVARWVEREYLTRRLAKPNGTTVDLDRIKARLIARVSAAGPRAASAAAGSWLDRMPGLLLDSTLPMPRYEAMLQVMLAAREREAGLALRLVPALRNSNVDARRRVQMALVQLAESRRLKPAETLADWDPTEGDAITDIERRIDEWRSFWRQVPRKPVAPPAPSPDAGDARSSAATEG